MKSIEIKEAETIFPVHELIKKRWSARSFSDRPLPQDVLNTVFEAASWAASSMNEQPWEYVYALKSDQKEYDKFVECLMQGNQPWAADAPVLILSLAKKHFKRNGKVNRHAWHDTGAANTNLMLQATHMDIYGHMMAGFDRNKTIELFDLPDHLEPVCFIALGYLEEPDKLDQPFLDREITPRKRQQLEEFVHQNKLNHQ